jgi:dipeptidyl-peptidase-4
MSPRTALLATALFALALPAAAQEKLTPERVFKGASLNGPTARGVAFSPDGELVTYLRPKAEDQTVLDLWAAPTDGGEPFRLIDARALSPEPTQLSEAEFARRDRMRITESGVVEYQWDSQGRSVLVPLDGDLWLAPRDGSAPRRLTRTPADEIAAKVSPKGAWVSFVRDQDLWLLDPATGAERALTTDGEGLITYATADFIAAEELDRDDGYWWSPDDARIAYTRVDESPVDVVPRTDIGAEGSTVVMQRYPRAGRPNALTELWIVDVATGERRKADLGPDTDVYLARVDWAKDGRTVFAQRLTREQRRLDVLAIDAATGVSRVILTETAPHWVELTHDFRPLKDGSFLWTSERSGARHVYHHAADGRLIRQVTRGPAPVAQIEAVDEARGTVRFEAALDTPLEMRLYETSYRRPGTPRALTPAGGVWDTTSAEGGAFVGTYQDPRTPPRTALYDRTGKRLRWIEENRLDDSHPYAPFLAGHRTPEFGTLIAADGQTLHYSLTTPPGFDPNKQYPAIMVVYGGPGVQRVSRSWQPVAERLFLDAGYVVFKLDNRGTSPDTRDVRFKSVLNRNLGGPEVEDQLLGRRWLSAQPFVDGDRVGVYGWSYGGYMALLMMQDGSRKFAAGVSGAPVTDWRLYDTAYTERYMGKPQDEQAAYDRSSPLLRAGELHGELLLIHGMADDNVVFDNSTRMMARLQELNRPFDLMTYPGQRHSAVRTPQSGPHVWTTMLRFFDRHLAARD